MICIKFLTLPYEQWPPWEPLRLLFCCFVAGGQDRTQVCLVPTCSYRFLFSHYKSQLFFGVVVQAYCLDVKVKYSSKTRPGFAGLLLKFLCHSVAQLSTVCVTT